MAALIVGEQSQDLGVPAIAAVPGTEGEPSALPVTGGSLGGPAQDVVMTAAAPGVEEASSTSLGPPGAPDTSTE
jgi:hypothetical protein